MYKKLILFFFITFVVILAQDKFEEVEVPTQENLNSIFFHDIKNGWIVGNNGVVLKTIDSGNIWELIELGTEENFHTVHFIDDSVGWISGNKTYFTVDRFRNYSIIDRKNAFFVDSLNVWSFRWTKDHKYKPRTGGDVFEYSNDAGQTWTIVDEYILEYTDCLIYNMNTMLTIGGDIYEQDRGFVRYSEDSGLTWNKTLEAHSTCFDFISLIEDSCLLVWGMDMYGGQVHLSKDLGMSWKYVFGCMRGGGGIENSLLLASYFINSNFGWVVTSDYITSEEDIFQQIKKTEDGGKTWVVIKKELTGNHSRFKQLALFGIDKDDAWLSGQDGYVLKMSNMNNSEVDSLYNNLQSALIYPNPVRHEFTLRIPCINDCKAIIKLYNIKGQTVLNHKCTLNVGENNIELNVFNLSNGIYIVNIYTEGALEYKPLKLIVVHN